MNVLIYLSTFPLDKILEGSIWSVCFNSQEMAVEAKVGVVVAISSKSYRLTVPPFKITGNNKNR